MNKVDIIDYALTDDVNFFVFGGVRLIRQISATDDEVSIYTATWIRELLHLTTDDLVLYAILTGGDYHPGLKGCGAVTAQEFVSSGYASSLMMAFRAMAGPRSSISGLCPGCLAETGDRGTQNQSAWFVQDETPRRCSNLESGH
jgi:hypothetical protein